MKNKYTKMYLKYIHFMPSILQIHLHINTQQLYFWYTKLKSAKLEQVILYFFFFLEIGLFYNSLRVKLLSFTFF